MSTLAYVRISRGAKPGAYGSFEFQKDAIERYCNEHGLSDVKWLIDYGNSGLNGIGKQTLKSLAGNHAVVMTGPDRFSRKITECLDFFTTLPSVHFADFGNIWKDVAPMLSRMRLLERDVV